MSELQNPPQQPNEPLSPLDPPPKNYLVEAILLTAFCCMPLGVVSLVHAAKVNSEWESGNREQAVKSAAEAKKWAKYGLIAGLSFYVLFIGFYAIVIIAAIASEGGF